MVTRKKFLLVLTIVSILARSTPLEAFDKCQGDWYRPCRPSDLLGRWELARIETGDLVVKRDSFLAGNQEYEFLTGDVMIHIAGEENRYRYRLDDAGVLSFGRIFLWPGRLQCTFLTDKIPDSSGERPAERGNIFLTRFSPGKNVVYQQLLRKKN